MGNVLQSDITPGPGVPGVETARLHLLTVLLLGINDVLLREDYWFLRERRAEVLSGKGNAGKIRVTFDDRTILMVEPWPLGASYYAPVWYFQHSQGGKFDEGPFKVLVDETRHVKPILERVAGILSGVKVVRQTPAQEFDEGRPRR